MGREGDLKARFGNLAPNHAEGPGNFRLDRVCEGCKCVVPTLEFEDHENQPLRLCLSCWMKTGKCAAEAFVLLHIATTMDNEAVLLDLLSRIETLEAFVNP